jgi:TolB-like protein
MTRTHLIAGAALVVAGAALLAGLRGRWASAPERSPATSSGMAASLTVEPFAASDAPRGWSSAALAESLAARLARAPGLAVRTAGGSFGPHADFRVRGEVTGQDGRLVIAARLYRDGERDALWTATFWRGDSLTSDLVSDLAGAVVEAVYGALARRMVTDTGGHP